MTAKPDHDADLQPSAARGLWLLPVYGALLASSTFEQQPSVEEDFAGYARFVTTNHFLVSHLAASIGGVALAVLGAAAAVVFLARGPARRAALTGLVLFVVGQVYLAAAFGSAAFVQPGIGRAHHRGMPGIESLNADTAYGPVLFATALAAVLVTSAGAVALGRAAVRTSVALRWAGTGIALALPLFSVSGILGFPAGVQPTFGLLFTAATVLLARRLPSAVADASNAAVGHPAGESPHSGSGRGGA